MLSPPEALSSTTSPPEAPLWCLALSHTRCLRVLDLVLLHHVLSCVVTLTYWLLNMIRFILGVQISLSISWWCFLWCFLLCCQNSTNTEFWPHSRRQQGTRLSSKLLGKSVSQEVTPLPLRELALYLTLNHVSSQYWIIKLQSPGNGWDSAVTPVIRLQSPGKLWQLSQIVHAHRCREHNNGITSPQLRQISETSYPNYPAIHDLVHMCI